MLAIVDGLANVADSVIGRINTAEQLASYSSIHPLYIQVGFCCSPVLLVETVLFVFRPAKHTAWAVLQQ